MTDIDNSELAADVRRVTAITEDTALTLLALEEDDSGRGLSACGLVLHESVPNHGPRHEETQWAFSRLRLLEAEELVEFVEPSGEADFTTVAELTPTGWAVATGGVVR